MAAAVTESEPLPHLFHLLAVFKVRGAGAGADEGQHHWQEHQPVERTTHDDAAVPASTHTHAKHVSLGHGGWGGGDNMHGSVERTELGVP